MPLEREKGYLPSDVWFLVVTIKTESMDLGGREEMESLRMLLPRLKNNNNSSFGYALSTLGGTAC